MTQRDFLGGLEVNANQIWECGDRGRQKVFALFIMVWSTKLKKLNQEKGADYCGIFAIFTHWVDMENHAI